MVQYTRQAAGGSVHPPQGDLAEHLKAFLLMCKRWRTANERSHAAVTAGVRLGPWNPYTLLRDPRNPRSGVENAPEGQESRNHVGATPFGCARPRHQ